MIIIKPWNNDDVSKTSIVKDEDALDVLFILSLLGWSNKYYEELKAFYL